MAPFITLCLAALLRGLAAHGVSLSLEAIIAAPLPFLPPRACALIAILIAVVVVETLAFLVKRALRRWRATPEDEAGK